MHKKSETEIFFVIPTIIRESFFLVIYPAPYNLLF